MSWPQACITPTSAPVSSFAFFVEAYASCVFSTTGRPSMSVRIIKARARAIFQNADGAISANAGRDLAANRAGPWPASRPFAVREMTAPALDATRGKIAAIRRDARAPIVTGRAARQTRQDGDGQSRDKHSTGCIMVTPRQQTDPWDEIQPAPVKLAQTDRTARTASIEQR